MTDLVMNETQYDITQRMMKIGAAPKDIATSFKIKLNDVLRVQATHNYEQYKVKKDNPLEDMMRSMGLGL